MLPVEPSIISFLISDMVIQEKVTNKWSAIGIFDNIIATQFPLVYPRLALYIRLSDAEGDYDIRVEFCDDKDCVIAIFEGIRFSIPSRLHNPELGITTLNLPIQKPGKFNFKLYFNGKWVGDFPLIVEEYNKNKGKDIDYVE